MNRLSRRSFMAISGASALALPLRAAGTSAKPLTGRVFVRNTGRGIPGVAVSDGRNVVLTDMSGRFSLPGGHRFARFVSVSVPNGWRTDCHYRAVKNGGSYDFPMTEWKPSARGSHRFIQITDTEISSANTDYNRRMAAELKEMALAEDAAFIVHTGDICYKAGMRDHIRLVNSRNMGVPVYYCIGNHDLVSGPYGEAFFEEYYGPCWYSFNAGGVHYAVLPMERGDYAPSYSRADAAAWLKNDLAVLPKGTPLVCFEHNILTGSSTFDYAGLNLNSHGLKAWFFGHWHYNYCRMQGNVLVSTPAPANKGGIDSSAAAFRIVNMTETGGITTDLRYGHNPGSFAAHLSKDGTCTVSVYRCAVRTLSLTAQCNGKTYTGEQLSPYAWRITGFKPGDRVRFTAKLLRGEIVQSVTLPSAPEAVWQTNAGGEVFMSSPVRDGQRIFIGTTDENLRKEGGVTAFDAATGKRLWHAAMPASVKHSIAAADGLVFAQDTEGWVRAFRQEDGSVAWEDRMPIAMMRSVGGVTAAAGVLYAGVAQWFTAYETKTGRRIWRGGHWNINEATPDVPAVDLKSGIVMQGGHWKSLYANDLANGHYMWDRNSGGLRFRGPIPAFENGYVWVAGETSLYRLEVKTGKQADCFDIKPNKLVNGGRPLICDDRILVSTANAGVVAVDKKSGRIRWQLKTGAGLGYAAAYGHYPDALVQGSPIRTDDRRVCFAGADGVLYIADIQSGRLLRKIAFGAPIFGSPLFSDGCIYVADLGGTVSCVRV